MNTALIVLLCVAGGLLALALGWLITSFAAKKALVVLEKRMKPVIEARFTGREVLKTAYEANFFGQLSKGLVQVRGNGALVLTRDELFFLQAVTNKEVIIPLTDITEVSVVRSHLKKWVWKPLLRVDHASGGVTDAAAWFVYDPPAWKEAVEAAASSGRAVQD